MQDRRSFCRALGAAALAAGLPRPLSGALSTNLERLERIGLQLYTVRHQLERDFEGTLARVAEIGYTEVEFAGYFGRSPQAVKEALRQAGLRAPSGHLPFTLLRESWPQAIETAKIMGHRYLVVAWIPAEERHTLDDYKRVAELFNGAAQVVHDAGLEFAYHNHDYEFAPLQGRVPYDVLLEETDPETVALQVDLYWITKGGGDPIEYFARYPRRFPMVHVKDSAGAPEHRMVDVGRGVIDFKSIFARRNQAGIRHFFVEHDNPPDALASARASYQYLSRLEF